METDNKSKIKIDDDPDFEPGGAKRKPSLKKRKRSNEVKLVCENSSKGGKHRDNGNPMPSNEGKPPKNDSKVRTLDQMFASMKKSTVVPVDSSPKKSDSGTPLPVKTMSPVKSLEVVDLTSPDPPKKLKLTEKLSRNENASKTVSASRKKAEFRKIKLKIALKRREKRRKKIASIFEKAKTMNKQTDLLGKNRRKSEQIAVLNGTKIEASGKPADGSCGDDVIETVPVKEKRTRSCRSIYRRNLSSTDESIAEKNSKPSDELVEDLKSSNGRQVKKRKTSIENDTELNESVVSANTLSKTPPCGKTKTTKNVITMPAPTKKAKKLQTKEVHPLMAAKLNKNVSSKLSANSKKGRISRKQHDKSASRTNKLTVLNSSQKKGDVKVNSTLKHFKLSNKDPKQHENRRKSSAENVICVGEVKKPEDLTYSNLIKDDMIKKREENYGLSALPCETILWTEKYEPISAADVIGNSASVTKLSNWLKKWRERWEREKRELEQQESQKSMEGDDSDSDFELDNEDRKTLKEEDNDTFPKIAFIIGPHGCGKTASVYASARDVQFKILEMNSSSQRSSKQISRLHEATQSHQMSKATSAFNFFRVKGQEFKGQNSNENKTAGDSLILFKDVDVIFDDDKFFWSAIDTLVEETKRPIVLTTSNDSVLVNIEKKYEKIYFGPPSVERQIECVQSIAVKENFSISENSYSDVKMMMSLHHCDLKKTIHALHFWGGSNLTATSDTDKTAAPVGKKKRKNGRRKSLPAKQKISSEEEKNSVLRDLFSKTAGIYDFLPKIQAAKSEESGFLSILKLLRSHEEPNLKVVESAISHMILSSLPPVIKINWTSLMLCYDDVPPITVGKKYLEISVPKMVVDCEREFAYEFDTEENRSFVDQDVVSEYLIDEDSSDTPYENVPIQTTRGNEAPDKAETEAAKSKLNKDSLDVLSRTADTICMLDCMEGCLSKFQKSNQKSALDVSRCKIKDGLANAHSSETELTHQAIMLSAEIQAAIQVRTITLANSELSKLCTDWVSKAPVLSKLPLRLPHEGKSRKNNQYLRHSIQSQCVGGLLTSSRYFTSDFLPMIRSICRSEQVRRESKKKRRFLHYFDRIRLFPKQSELTRLLNDFKEVPQSP